MSLIAVCTNLRSISLTHHLSNEFSISIRRACESTTQSTHWTVHSLVVRRLTWLNATSIKLLLKALLGVALIAKTKSEQKGERKDRQREADITRLEREWEEDLIAFNRLKIMRAGFEETKEGNPRLAEVRTSSNIDRNGGNDPGL